MKLQLSAKEAVAIIKAHLNLTQHVEIIIEPAPDAFADEDPRYVAIVNKTGKGFKLHAIKEMRTEFGLGLNDAKIIADRISTKLGFDNP